jgi:DNA (cytosine-5)-methyltransferase 1
MAWHDLGLKPQWFSEVAKFPSAVLAHRWPSVANVGDFTGINAADGYVDLIVGGTPCQDFSVTGPRSGLDGERGQLSRHYVRLLGRLFPRWFVWENVPGVLSSNEGRDFPALISEIAKIGYGVCWRVLDAQFFGVPQHRPRVFVVGYRRDWRPAAAVLFDSQSLRGDHKKKPKAPEIVGCITTRTGNSNDNISAESGHLVLDRMSGLPRWITPEEAEAAQGFPKGYTAIPWDGRPASECPDGPRYKAVGNSMPVPVMRWLGERIVFVESLIAKKRSWGY